MSNLKLIKIAAGLFAAGLILFFVGNLFGGKGVFLSNNFQVNVLSDSEYFEYENRDLQAFTRVKIDVVNMPVTVLPSGDGSYGVEFAYYAADKDDMTAEVKDGTFNIKYKTKMRWFSFDFSFIKEMNKEYVIVYLPEEEFETIEVSTSNGSISLENVDVAAEKLILDTSNGSISASDIRTELLTADTSNGTVNLSKIVSNDIRVKTSNAPVTVSDSEISALEIKTSNGPVSMDKLTFLDSERNISVKTSNGGITADFEKCREADFEIKADTSNANIFVNGDNLRDNHYTTNAGDGRMNLKTSNGRIEMYFGLD